MIRSDFKFVPAWLALAVALFLFGCAATPREVTVADHGRNAVAQWDDLAAVASTQPPAVVGTAEERRPVYLIDMATLHVAIYDAVVAIAGGHQPLIAGHVSGATGASEEAAAHAAAHAVLTGLFPQRAAGFQAAFESAIAALPSGAARERGLQIGAEIAAQVLARRAGDGRWTAQASRVPGTVPGAFRGTDPILQFLPSVRPFTLSSAAQFRSTPPPPLDSPAYAADFNETRTLGGTAATPLRSAQQVEGAHFHSEPPFRFWPRNLHRFASSQPALVDNARLMAMLWVAVADSSIACFDAKYYHYAWRPLSAIALGDDDGNPATTADHAWAPLLPTPNHPEYPAAHSCASAAVAQTLSAFYGTRRLHFRFDSAVTQSTHEWSSVDAFIDEVRLARIVGGMHFRSATAAGETLGAQVARWVAERYFQPQ